MATATATTPTLANGAKLPRTGSLRSIGWACLATLGSQCPVALATAIQAACANTAWAGKPAAFYAHRARRTLALYHTA